MRLEDRYTEQMAQLLPPGGAWARWPGSVLRALLSGLAREFARIHQRALDLLNENDPRLAREMLPDWERYLGLPGDCAPPDQTQSERREAVVSKYTEVGGQSRQYFIDLAETLGFTVTITEYRPFVAGSLAGERLTNGDWIYTWDLNAPDETITLFKAGRSAAGEPLRVWGREAFVECELRKRAPAHTLVRFTYHAAPVTARDLTGNDNDGALINGPEWIDSDGPNEDMTGALSMDGEDDHVDTGNAFGFGLAESFTVEGWFFQIAGSGNTDGPDLVGKGTFQENSWGLAMGVDLSIDFELDANSEDHPSGNYQFRSVSDSPAPIGEWFHLAGVYDASNDLATLYVNGKSQDPVDTSGANGGWNNSNPVLFGKRTGDSDRWFQGRMSDIRIWSVARTQQQIQDNMNTRMTGEEAGLVGYWPMDDGVFPYPGVE